MQICLLFCGRFVTSISFGHFFCSNSSRTRQPTFQDSGVLFKLPVFSQGFCKLMALWYIYNQSYGLPSDMNLYIANINAGLHRKSDPESVVLAVSGDYRYIGWSKKMAQLLISHKFYSGLCSHMKLHTSQLHHVFCSHIIFKLNQIKNMEMPNGLKKGA